MYNIAHMKWRNYQMKREMHKRELANMSYKIYEYFKRYGILKFLIIFSFESVRNFILICSTEMVHKMVLFFGLREISHSKLPSIIYIRLFMSYYINNIRYTRFSQPKKKRKNIEQCCMCLVYFFFSRHIPIVFFSNATQTQALLEIDLGTSRKLERRY